jgi:hypothetical protein
VTGKIVVSGTSLNGLGPTSTTLAAYTSNGTLDPTFGTGGLTIPHTGGVSQFDMTMAVAPSGQIVLASAGQVVPGGGALDFNLARFNTGAAPSISISSVTQPVATSPTKMVFNLALSQALAVPVTVQFQTVDGTALAGQDYTAQSGTLTFVPGSTTAAITVAVLGNLYAEPAKSFSINLTNPSGVFANPSQVTGTIQNNNAATWVNPVNPLDVNGDGVVSPLDALVIINLLNSHGGGTLGAASTGVHEFLDPNADGVCSPLDALAVINFLNNQTRAAVASPQVVTAAGPAAPDPVVSSAVASSAVVSNAAVSSAVVSAASDSSPPVSTTEVGFALAAAARATSAAVVANSPAGTSATTAGSIASGSAGSSAAAPAAQNALSSSLRRTTDVGGKADVEDLLDLLARR